LKNKTKSGDMAVLENSLEEKAWGSGDAMA